MHCVSIQSVIICWDKPPDLAEWMELMTPLSLQTPYQLSVTTPKATANLSQKNVQQKTTNAQLFTIICQHL